MSAQYERMFFNTDNRGARTVASGIDIAIEFATLGEYRVVTDMTVRPPAGELEFDDLWATGIEWSSAERERATCSLPRARNREWARSRIRG